MFDGVVSEMGTNEDLKIDVPIAKGVDIKKLTEGDKDPLFVTIEALNTTISRSKRRYTPEVVKEIARQINEIKPDAYEGHLAEHERETKRPKPQTIWIGATVKEIGGKLRLFVKGYVLPYAKELKQYLKAAKAAGKKVAVSIYGQAKQTWNDLVRAYDVNDFHLESIDWARSGAEGVPTLGYLALTSEMKGEKLMNREDIVKDLTIGEIEELNPTIVSEMKSKLSDEITKTVKKEIEKETQSELNVIREMVGAKEKDNLKDVIKEMVDEIENLRQKVAGYYIDELLAKRISNKAARGVIKSMVVREIGNEYNLDTIAETVSNVIKSDEGKAIVASMNEAKIIVTPNVDNRSHNIGRKYTVIK